MATIDLNRYAWRKDGKVAGRVYREVSRGEKPFDFWNITKHGHLNLFLGIYTTFAVPLSESELLKHAKNAWTSLRWEVPTIASSTSHTWHSPDKMPTTFLTYDIGKSPEDVAEWADKTVRIYPDYASKTLDDLRYDIGQDPIPAKDHDLQAFLYLVPFSDTKFGFLLHTVHTLFDGAGVKILLTKFLTHFTKYITDLGYSTAQQETLKWGTEDAQLLPCVTNILRKREAAVLDDQGNVIQEERSEEYADGREYFQNFEDVMNRFATAVPRTHGFKTFLPFDPSTSKPKTKWFEHIFTVEESAKISQARLIPGNKLTVNHLVLAALCLLPIYDNPTKPGTDALIALLGIVDCRQRLEKKYRDVLAYPGLCIAASSLQLPVDIVYNHQPEDKKGILIDFAQVIKQEYAKQATYPALLAIQPQVWDLLLQVTPSPPLHVPQYSGDGKGSVYLFPKYPAEGPAIIEIDHFFVGLNNREPAPYFRCAEWKGRIILSFDFNELAVDDEVARGWLNTWVELMLTLTK